MKAESAHFDEKFESVTNSINVQFEAIRDDIKKLSERGERGFKAISQQIENLDKKWTATTLEQQRQP